MFFLDFMGFLMGYYPLVMTNIAVENGHRSSRFFPLNMAIFHSYVSLPEGKACGLTCHDVVGKPIGKWWFSGDFMGFPWIYPLVI